jgi:hypothetical protein
VFEAICRLRFRVGLCLLSVSLAASVHAQKDRREPLTPKQQDQIAEAGIDPDARLDLYIKFANEHAQTIEAVSKRTEKARGKRLDSELQNFTAIVDELASNLDEYAGRKADIRKALKSLNESVAHWQEILKGVPKDPVTDIALQDATDSISDLSQDAKTYSSDQDAYFKEHKDAKGQEREEPK